ncbi:hypothetical protein LCGC14_2344740 [marine sediment metagenome]|uniref:Uncharacterized protein n=1 Tax=marine sediment metagenome TaxID=412755 RepID=A0A0F9F627_9ZZZZ
MQAVQGAALAESGMQSSSDARSREDREGHLEREERRHRYANRNAPAPAAQDRYPKRNAAAPSCYPFGNSSASCYPNGNAWLPMPYLWAEGAVVACGEAAALQGAEEMKYTIEPDMTVLEALWISAVCLSFPFLAVVGVLSLLGILHWSW